ncbi:HTH domain-containing protein [Arcticibacter tournemirensis]|uniref:HTH domain-containing protein n=1 Tax=Arcticibacter tournemirensis TaxID=699437 RepID=A0A5M9GNB4_9SPHI|nr:HTH domain-containing protein [Arcticibacter tournemirensis]KAA8476162.1 HTH domain-containing protein [Arcticibacter tournemirensis]TQM50858.1 HTH domain-containing protein [Arcticibacter tournemirensis]
MFLQLFNRLERIDYLIRSKSTGTPDELARRLEMSERTLYAFIHEMRASGAPIGYSKTIRSYYYLKKGKFGFGFMEE